MLYKDDHGKVNLKEMKDEKGGKRTVKESAKNPGKSSKSTSGKSSSVKSPKSTSVKSPSFQSSSGKSSSFQSSFVNSSFSKSTPVKTNVTKPTATKTKSSPIIIENVEYKPPVKVNNPSSSNSKPEISLKPGHVLYQPAKVGPGSVKVETSPKKQDLNVTQSYTPLVKNFTLGKPIIIKAEVQNNKRKLDIVVESGVSKKPNKND